MKSEQKSTKSYLAAIIGLLGLLLVIAVGAGMYMLGTSQKHETNPYQQKSEQINSCAQSSPPITDTGNLEENYRKQQEYCASLYR